jgi:hypothetical protein
VNGEVNRNGNRRQIVWTTNQQKSLSASIITLTKNFARYSQRPDREDWPQQEWVLLQFSDINGCGQKNPKKHRSKTAGNVYGRNEAITTYNNWQSNTTNTKEGGDRFVHRSTSSLEELQSFWKRTEKIEAAGLPTHPGSGGEIDSNVGEIHSNIGASEQASSVDSKVTSLVQDNVEIAKVSSATPKESGGEIDSNLGASEQASSVDLVLTLLVQDNVEIAKISSATHPSMATYIKKYPNVFVPEFFGEFDAQRKQGTTKNAEDDSAGLGIIGGMLNSDKVENESVSESVEELHAIHSTAKSLLGGGTSSSGALSKSQRKNRRRRGKKMGAPSIQFQFNCCRHQNRYQIPWWKV